MRATALFKTRKRSRCCRASTEASTAVVSGATVTAMPSAMTRMPGSTPVRKSTGGVTRRSRRKPPARSRAPPRARSWVRRGPRFRPSRATPMREGGETAAAPRRPRSRIAGALDQHIGHEHEKRAQRAIEKERQDGSGRRSRPSRTRPGASSRRRRAALRSAGTPPGEQDPPRRPPGRRSTSRSARRPTSIPR